MSALGQKPTYALQQAMSALHPIATLIAFFSMSGLDHKRTSHRLFDHLSARSAGKAWLPNITTAQAHPHRIISRSITGNLSNKIIQKGLAFRCDRSATVFASGALLLLRDPAPPAQGLLRGFGGAAGGCT
jgi:hypothetical protein